MTPKPRSLLEKVQRATKAIRQQEARAADPTLKELKRFEDSGIIARDARGLYYQLPNTDGRDLTAPVKGRLVKDALARRREAEQIQDDL